MTCQLSTLLDLILKNNYWVTVKRAHTVSGTGREREEDKEEKTSQIPFSLKMQPLGKMSFIADKNAVCC